MTSDSPAQASTESGGDTPALAVTGLEKTFGGLVAVDGVTFDVPDGSIAGVVGPNGAGKTTVFNLIAGSLPADAGRVELDGADITAKSAPARTRAGLGRTFQTPRVFGGMTVLDNIRFAATDQLGESLSAAFTKPTAVARREAAVTERARDLAAFLDIDHLEDEYARTLSGGQRKLLELARVLMLDPAVLLLDEPTAGVNPALADDIVDRLHEINENGTTILLIEHDMQLVMNHCDEVVVLHDGQTLATGAPDLVRENEAVMEVYLGDV